MLRAVRDLQMLERSAKHLDRILHSLQVPVVHAKSISLHADLRQTDLSEDHWHIFSVWWIHDQVYLCRIFGVNLLVSRKNSLCILRSIIVVVENGFEKMCYQKKLGHNYYT